MATSKTNTTSEKRVESGSPFTEKTVAAAHEAIDRLSERVSKTEEHLREAAAHGQQNWSEKQDEVRAQVEGSVAFVKAYSRENPLMAAGIAFAAGVVIANMLRR